jgi:hypothetical protein
VTVTIRQVIELIELTGLIELSELIEFERERDHDCMQPEFHNKPGSSAHAWITDSAPESIERQHDRSRNRFSGTRLKKCARIGRPGGRQVAGGQAGGQKPCAPVTAGGPTQSEAVRGSPPPYSAVGAKASLWGVTFIITHPRLHFFGDSNSSIYGRSFPWLSPCSHSRMCPGWISLPESADRSQQIDSAAC